MVGSMGELGSLFRRTAGSYKSAEQVRETLESLPKEVSGRTVREVMCNEVAVIGCDDPVASVLEVFEKHHHSSYPVVNGQGQVLGLLKRSALYEWVQSRGMKPGVCVTEVPLEQVVRVLPDRPVAALFEELIRCGSSKAVVVDEKGVLKGMVALFDLMKG
jgi:NADH dehydrogenase